MAGLPLKHRHHNGSGDQNYAEASDVQPYEQQAHMEDDDEIDDLSDSQSEEPVKKSRRPKENAFTQQKLRAFHPILTPKTVIPLLLTIAVIFIPIGAAMIYGSSKVEEFVIDYSNCATEASSDYWSDIPTEYTSFKFKEEITVQPKWKLATNDSHLWDNYPEERNICQVQFQIPDDIGPHVYFFYRIRKFYPNHRRYAISFSEDQLNGKEASTSVIKDTVGQNCQPLSINHEGKKYYPCGLIANSLFNDTFTPFTAVNDTTGDFTMYREGIAWDSNKSRFKKTKYDLDDIVPPPNWIKAFPNGYNTSNVPDLETWYEFQNWMAPSAFSLFSKMVLRNDDDKLTKGTYQTNIGLHWPVDEFKGHKYIYLSTRSVIGGKNPFLGISWVVGGGICLLLSVGFLLVNIVHPRRTGDTSLLSWNKEEAQ